MKINEIKSALVEQHSLFIACTGSLNKAAIEFYQPGKWSASRQVKHILKSVQPLTTGLMLPKFLFRFIWGTANRSSKTYAELVAKYQFQLSQGGKASRPFIPSAVEAEAVPGLHAKIIKSVIAICRHLDKYSEADLDRYILPHPLLGKLTLREMMYFTIYHVQHHLEIIKRDGVN
jgi:hypothetical protein